MLRHSPVTGKQWQNFRRQFHFNKDRHVENKFKTSNPSRLILLGPVHLRAQQSSGSQPDIHRLVLHTDWFPDFIRLSTVLCPVVCWGSPTKVCKDLVIWMRMKVCWTLMLLDRYIYIYIERERERERERENLIKSACKGRKLDLTTPEQCALFGELDPVPVCYIYIYKHVEFILSLGDGIF